MKITAVTAYPLRSKLDQAFGFSQWTFTHRETTLVNIQTHEGIEGWGEAYGPARLTTAAVRDFFAPLVVGRDPRDVEALWELMFVRSLDYGQKGIVLAAISAIDIALWDIKARATGVPLYRLLGGAETESVRCYATGFYFGGDERLEDRFEREAKQYLADGFGAMKMKVGLGVERDAELVGHLRSVIGPGVRLMIDANHAYTAVEAVALGRRIERHGIYWFEEPTSPLSIDGYLEVKSKLAIPIAGGEAEYTRFGFEPWLRRRAFDFAQPDICGCGGISEAMKIATLASVHGVHVTPHAWGSAVGQSTALHFYAARPRHPSTTTAEDKLIECDRTESPFRTTIVEQPIRFDGGAWCLPHGPGLGIEVIREEVERFVLRNG
jgi:D-galactarolactone cycloisomerase